jgi:transcriptional regulator
MYVNPHYAERELPVLHEMIEAAPFGLLVLSVDGPLAAHIPFVPRRDQGRYGTLVAQVARIDPLARHLAAGAQRGIHIGKGVFRAGPARIVRKLLPV